jgi:hypothetical protein
MCGCAIITVSLRTIDALLFLIGSAYFVAGSYPSPENAASVPEEKPLLLGEFHVVLFVRYVFILLS